ncbi:hypothetical protein NDU88_003691 [Pleurodeles waltl]|uniref:Uncharacterized protein n=1 Tax=Pleurodeles waltl TaxID=8319 RepID=A0AAV7L4L5_PLEWA|nr:hypothetical protein NDU88_003691 [Pleurodeles waltl]
MRADRPSTVCPSRGQMAAAGWNPCPWVASCLKGTPLATAPDGKRSSPPPILAAPRAHSQSQMARAVWASGTRGTQLPRVLRSAAPRRMESGRAPPILARICRAKWLVQSGPVAHAAHNFRVCRALVFFFFFFCVCRAHARRDGAGRPGHAPSPRAPIPAGWGARRPAAAVPPLAMGPCLVCPVTCPTACSLPGAGSESPIAAPRPG